MGANGGGHGVERLAEGKVAVVGFGCGLDAENGDLLQAAGGCVLRGRLEDLDEECVGEEKKDGDEKKEGGEHVG